MTVRIRSFVNEINRELTQIQNKKISAAALFLRNKLKEKISLKYGQDSDLYKGVMLKKEKKLAKVGMGSPASHAHLIEFGTDDRYTKTGKFSGHVAPQPFVFPTFEENADEVEKIISETWL